MDRQGHRSGPTSEIFERKKRVFTNSTDVPELFPRSGRARDRAVHTSSIERPERHRLPGTTEWDSDPKCIKCVAGPAGDSLSIVHASAASAPAGQRASSPRPGRRSWRWLQRLRRRPGRRHQWFRWRFGRWPRRLRRRLKRFWWRLRWGEAWFIPCVWLSRASTARRVCKYWRRWRCQRCWHRPPRPNCSWM